MAPVTFPLYGYERFFAMNPDTSAKLAHVMTLHGDITELLKRLPSALLATFNLHPKMRVSILPGVSPQKGMICSPLVDVTELKDIYRVIEREDAKQSSDWMEFVQQECEIPINREKEYPYYVRVIVSEKKPQTFAHLILFSDHYMSDAISGRIVLNAILQNATMQRNNGSTNYTAGNEGEHTADIFPNALPLRPSLYESMHWVNPWLGVVNEAVSKWLITPMVNFDQAGFHPSLPINTDQHDFQGGAPRATPKNPSFALFAQGSPANMASVLQRCQAENVTLRGAVIAAVTIAFGLVEHNGRLQEVTGPIRLKMDVTYNMRKHLKNAAEEEVVGLYSTAGNLVFASSQGVDPHKVSFWDLCRKAELECQCVLEGHELQVQSVFVNETLNAENESSHLQVSNSVLSDATIAHADTYPYARDFQLLTSGDGHASQVTVESLHVYNSLPSLTSASMFFLNAVSSFNYSMMYKLEHTAAKQLFHWYVECVEHMGEFGTNETIVAAAQHLTPPPQFSAATTSPSGTSSTTSAQF